MSDVPDSPAPGTPTVTRRIFQPQDESPEIYMKDGILVSKDPTKPKIRAEFKVEEPIRQTFDTRPLFQALDMYVANKDLKGFIKCWENCTIDIKTLDNHVYVTLKPGD